LEKHLLLSFTYWSVVILLLFSFTLLVGLGEFEVDSVGCRP
jgi:hypothetical protein